MLIYLSSVGLAAGKALSRWAGYPPERAEQHSGGSVGAGSGGLREAEGRARMGVGGGGISLHAAGGPSVHVFGPCRCSREGR